EWKPPGPGGSLSSWLVWHSRRNRRRRSRLRRKRFRLWIDRQAPREFYEPKQKLSYIGNQDRARVAGHYGPSRRLRKLRWQGGYRGSRVYGWQRWCRT